MWDVSFRLALGKASGHKNCATLAIADRRTQLKLDTRFRNEVKLHSFYYTIHTRPGALLAADSHVVYIREHSVVYEAVIHGILTTTP